jgi:nucleoside-diphosphate-sugar epimerase
MKGVLLTLALGQTSVSEPEDCVSISRIVKSASVVTGGAGFVGAALVRRLLALGDEVRTVVLPGDPLIRELRATTDGARLEIIEADVTDFDALGPVVAGAARVFHTAALVHAWAPPGRFRAVNVGGTRNVAEAVLAHGVARLVHVSSSDVFGLTDGDRVLDEASPFRPWGEPYADTKIEAEEQLWSLHRERGLPLTVIYPGWVYGPGDRAFFPGLADAIAGGFMVFWARDVRLAWAYVENLVDACVRASEEPRAIGQGYLVYDTSAGPTLEEVCARIATTIGARPPTLHVPYAIALAAARLCELGWRIVGARTPPPLRSVDVKAFGATWRFSNAKARRDLGWSPRVETEEGMRRALDFLVAERAAAAARRF